MHRRVVGWVPVPKAIFGSRVMTTSLGSGAYSSHEGRTTRRSPMRCTCQYCCQLVAQSSSGTTRVASCAVPSSPTEAIA
ncbi:hypothetical protein D3C87_1950340 [compost metagenome]